MENASFADTAASLNYKWVKDSYASQNHPTADGTTATFGRGQLESSRKEQIKRMARILDDYRSPADLRALRAKTERSLQPRAASSPKSDSMIMQSKRGESSHLARSMSPTPTSQSYSWKKHSMRNPDISTERPGSSETQYNSMRDSDSRAKTSNYRIPHVDQVDDSYWQQSLSKLDPAEATPSPLRPQQFYTAKQSAHRDTIVEGLKIASPQMLSSPSARVISKTDQVSDHASSQVVSDRESLVVSLNHEPSFVPSPRQNPGSRRSSIDSELSKVDSQTTSLQYAISRALQETVQQDRQHDLLALPVDEAISARYRQSRHERSNINSGMPTFVAQTKEEFIPKSTGIIREPLKQASPLLDKSSAEWQKAQDVLESPNRGMITQIHDQSRLSEVLSTLEKVTDECSRRGQIIDSMVKDINTRSPNHDLEIALDNAQKRANSLEDQMMRYQAQIDEMQQVIKSLQLPKSPIQESVEDKIGRWNDAASEHILERAESILRESAEIKAPLDESNKDGRAYLLSALRRAESEIAHLKSTQLDHSMTHECNNHDKLYHECLKLRTFAEQVHASLYDGSHIEGAITARQCLDEMHARVDRLVRRRKRTAV